MKDAYISKMGIPKISYKMASSLSFKMQKIQNTLFVGNLIPSTTCEFYYDDVTMTSFIDIKYSDVADKKIP